MTKDYDDYEKLMQDRDENNIPTDDSGRTFHEQDEDFALGVFLVIIFVLAVSITIIVKTKM